MNPGRYSDRVTIEEKSTVPGPTGASSSWAVVGTRWAKVIPLSVEARAQYGSLRGVISHKVVIEGKVELQFGKHRLKWASKTLELAEPAQFPKGNTVVAVKEV